jgi:hypothetical protein
LELNGRLLHNAGHQRYSRAISVIHLRQGYRHAQTSDHHREHRPTRAADLVAPWVIDRARAHGGFEVEVLDLRDWPLPMFPEHMGSIGDLNDPTYSEPIVSRWNQMVKEGDAYLVVTPEYNHSVPGVLKNAIDSVFVSFAFRNKPVAAVGYSGGLGAGIRAIEHLALDDLVWWASAVARAREEGPLPPAAFPIQAAAAAVHEVEDEALCMRRK